MGGVKKLLSFLLFSYILLIFLIPIQEPVGEQYDLGKPLHQECVQRNYQSVDFLNVRNIQNFLFNEKFFDGKISGYFDENLLSSLKKFQEFVGIRIDGIMGPSTHKAMTAYNNCTSTVEADFMQCSGYLAYKECTFL